MSDTLSAGTLFREHARFVARFLVTLGVGPKDLDDLVQEVFVVVHKKGGFTVDKASPRTYLAAIAVLIAKVHFRGRRASESLEAEASEVVDPRRPDLDAETAESLAFVRRALERLSDEKRAAFILYEIDGESSESIAAAFGVPVGTVYSRLHHARQEFFASVERMKREPRVP